MSMYAYEPLMSGGDRVREHVEGQHGPHGCCVVSGRSAASVCTDGGGQRGGARASGLWVDVESFIHSLTCEAKASEGGVIFRVVVID